MTIEVEVNKHDLLSKKEESVFALLAKGMTYQAIAEHTHRSEDTVKTHAKAIREKLHASSILQAVAIAVARGIISIKEVGGKGLFFIFLTVSASFLDQDLIRHGRIARPQITRTRDNV